MWCRNVLLYTNPRSIITIKSRFEATILFFSGNLYHSGEYTQQLSSYSKGDVITCVFDSTERTLSFGVNGALPDVAFRDIEVSRELYPCVMFYSSNSGEQVKISDFQVTKLF